MNNTLLLMSVFFMCITALVLVIGIFFMGRGGLKNKRWGNRLMAWRVTFQIISLILILLGAWIAA